MSGSGMEQALSLLATANNHGDLAVKLSSLRQAKDILLSVEPFQAADLFPFLVELQYSPEVLVRKYLLEVIDEIGAKTKEHLSVLFPVLLTFLKDNNHGIAKQTIITGSKFFYVVVEELSFQFQRRGIVDRWLEELWHWMIKFRNALLEILFESDSAGYKLMALKFLEMYILHFTLDSNGFAARNSEVMIKQGRMFNISWIMDGHPVLDRPSLASEAIRYLGILFDLLPSSSVPGSLTIAAISSLAAIARKRPVYYKSVLAALLEFKPNVEVTKARHIISIQYALKTAFLGFLRCTHPIILESRDRLLKELRAMNAGDAADQAIRQVEKIMKNNGRSSRDPYSSKDDQLSNQLRISGDETKKRMASIDNEGLHNNFSGALKRPRYGPQDNAVLTDDTVRDHNNGMAPKLPVFDGDLSPVEQMIALISALIAEGERGVGSLEILISKTHPDLLADIVITNMKHLPKNPPPLTRYNHPPLDHPSDSSTDAQLVAPNGLTSYLQTADFSAQVPPSNVASFMSSDIPISTDLKRDPRRDPRRQDPRRMVVPVDVPLTPAAENIALPVQAPAVKSDSASSNFPPVLPHLPFISDSASEFLLPTTQKILTALESNVLLQEELIPKDELQDFEGNEFTQERETNISLHASSSLISKVEDINQASGDFAVLDEAYSPPSQETDQLSPDMKTEMLEVASIEMPVLPMFVELTEDNQVRTSRLALERIIKSYQSSQRTDFKQTQVALIARLFALVDVNDVLGELQKHVLSDYGQQKGHELVMHILYYLHSLMISDPASSTAAIYERFVLGVAKSLINDLPASDKSFSRLLGEIPSIPDSVMGLLGDICIKSNSGSDGRDGDRVTQGLGAIWSLILGRPPYRQACVDIALKCAIHPKDDVRAKATRLVSNKLYALTYLAQDIEKYGTDMFLSAMDHQFSTESQSQAADSGNRIGEQVEFTETSTSGSQVSEFGNSQNEDSKVTEEASMKDSSSLFPQAYTLMSLFFALCAKKPILLRQVFDNYGQAPKACKQAVHRHITALVRSLGSSSTEWLDIISDPPHGSEDLLVQVLHLLSEGTTPPAHLVATIKQLYETRLKDAAILIPILSAFTRDEVLPIFPQLVQLPLPKFQTALAHILQGSAHTGPALTPVEVLVAIHDISPDREGLPLKKIMDACSACFEQRTVFTQQVLTKALSQMVDRTPLPLLFMRTVIQAIDAFPTMVNVIMEILSKLVNRQIWRMPKLWVGFLKCIFQTQPHSFHVLLQLPSPQLESALNKYPNLRDPLTAYVNQSSIKTSVQRSTLALLGLA